MTRSPIELFWTAKNTKKETRKRKDGSVYKYEQARNCVFPSTVLGYFGERYEVPSSVIFERKKMIQFVNFPFESLCQMELWLQ